MSAPGERLPEITEGQELPGPAEPGNIFGPPQDGTDKPFLQEEFQRLTIAPGKSPNALGQVFQGNRHARSNRFGG